MIIEKLTSENIEASAKLMSIIKPQFWDYDGALHQLSNGIGWVCSNNGEKPCGWILTKEYKKYSSLEIECLGFDKDGIFTVDNNLEPLVKQTENWAKENGYRMIRFIIGSRGLSCHQKKINNAWETLRDLKAIDRDEFDWYFNMGFKPTGILPNTYGDGFHGIMLIKSL